MNRKTGAALLALVLSTTLSSFGCGIRDPRFALLSSADAVITGGYANNKVDILWVIDNSGTMGPKQANLAASVNSFMSEFVNKTFDYKIAVTTTDIRAVDPMHPADPNFSGQHACFVGSPTVITPATANPVGALASNAQVGFFGSSDAHGLDAARLALSAPNDTGCNSGFLRSDAYLAVIMFSDADDNTTATSASLVTFLDGLKPSITTPSGRVVRQASVSSMVVDNLSDANCTALGPFSELGTKFMQLSGLTDGIVASICAPDFSNGLLSVGTKILEETTAVRLSRTPQENTISVTMDGNFIANSATNGWTFNSTLNSIYFHGSAIPLSSNVFIRVGYVPADIIR